MPQEETCTSYIETMPSEDGDGLDLSDSQRNAMKNLKNRIGWKIDTRKERMNHFLYRWLSDQHWNVDEAEAAISKWQDWRKKMDQTLEEYEEPEVLREYFKHLTMGFDKDSCPVVYVPVGSYDLKGLFSSAKSIDIQKSLIGMMDSCEKYLNEHSEKTNTFLSGVLGLVNLEGLIFANATHKIGLETFLSLLKTYQVYYPERLKGVYFINAPSVFNLPFTLIKTFFGQKLLSRIHILPKDAWQEEFLKMVDASELPVFLGGTRTDPDGDPRCLTFANQGGKIDEKYCNKKSRVPLKKRAAGVKKLELTRASFSEIFLNVEQPNSIIEFEFETKIRDIGFGIFYKQECEDDDEEHMVPLLPLERIDTTEFSESGICQCEKAGDYVIVFDNSYSWLRGKEIYYFVRVLSPKEQEDLRKKF